jgi:hypothetical protein
MINVSERERDVQKDEKHFFKNYIKKTILVL